MIVITGNYPRSENLIQKTRDFDRNRIDYTQLQNELEKEFHNFLQFQRSINPPFYSTGLFNYQDLIRPFSTFIENSYTNTLIRFEETNIFWRKLEVELNKTNHENPINRNFSKYLTEYLKINIMKDFNYLVSLPSPLTLTKYSSLSIKDSNNLLIEISIMIQEEWEKISNNKLALTFIEYTEVNDTQHLIEFFNKMNQINLDSNIKLFLFLKNKIKNIDMIDKIKADGISINFYSNPINNIKDLSIFNNFENVFLGIINTNTTLLEDLQKIRSFIEYFKKFYKYNVFITDDFYAELLPREVLDQKLENLIKNLILT
ncbi:MAG: hypothetical protein N2169_00165 [bacterium]|nr:hypothetical protein [bacterium]